MMIKLSKVKEGNNLESNNTRINLLRTVEFIRLSADFSAGMLQARRECKDIIDSAKRKKLANQDISGRTVLQKWKRNKNLPR